MSNVSQDCGAENLQNYQNKNDKNFSIDTPGSDALTLSQASVAKELPWHGSNPEASSSRQISPRSALSPKSGLSKDTSKASRKPSLSSILSPKSSHFFSDLSDTNGTPLTPSAIKRLQQQSTNDAIPQQPLEDILPPVTDTSTASILSENSAHQQLEPSTASNGNLISDLSAKAKLGAVIAATTVGAVGANLSARAVEVALTTADGIMKQTAEHIPIYTSLEMDEVVRKKNELLNELSKSVLMLRVTEENAKDYRRMKEEYEEMLSRQKTIEMKEAEIESIQLKLVNLQVEVQVLRQEKEEDNQQIETLQSALAEITDENSKLNIVIQSLTEQRVVWLDEKEQMIQCNQTLQSKYNNDLESWQDKMTRLQQEYTKNLESWQEKLTQQQSQHQQAVDTLTQLNKTLEQQLQEMIISKEDAIHQMEMSREFVDVDMKAMQMEVSRNKAALESATSTFKSTILSKEKELDTLSRELSDKNVKLELLEAQRLSLEEELKASQTSSMEKATAYVELSLQYESKVSEIEKLIKERLQIVSSNENDVNNLRREVLQLQERIVEMQTENDLLTSKNNILSLTLDGSKHDVSKVLKDMEDKLSQVSLHYEEELASQRSKIHNILSALRDDYMPKLRDLKVDQTTLRDAVEDTQSFTSHQLQFTIHQLQQFYLKQYQTFKDNIFTLRNELEHLRAYNNELENKFSLKLNESQSDKENVLNILDMKNNEISHLTEVSNNLQEKFDVSLQHINALELNLMQVKDELKGKMQAFELLQSEHSTATNDSLSKYNKMNEKCLELEHINSQLSVKLSEKDKALCEVHEALKMKDASFLEAVTKLEESHKLALNARIEEIGVLSTEKQDRENALDMLQRQCGALESRLKESTIENAILQQDIMRAQQLLAQKSQHFDEKCQQMSEILDCKEKELMNTKASLTQAVLSVKALFSEVYSLRHEFSQRKEEVNRIVSSYEDTFAQEQMGIKSAVEAIVSSEAAKVDEIRRNFEKLLKEREEVEASNLLRQESELKTALLKLETQSESLKSDLSQLQDERDALKADISEMKGLMHREEAARLELQQRFNESQSHAQYLQQLQSESQCSMDSLKAELMAAETDRDTLRSRLTESENKLMQLSQQLQFQSELRDRTESEQILSLQRHVEKLNSALEEKEAANRELNQAVHDEKASNSELSTALTVEKSSALVLRNQLSTTIDEMKALRGSFESERMLVKELRVAVDTEKERADRLNNEMTALNGYCQTLERSSKTAVIVVQQMKDLQESHENTVRQKDELIDQLR